MRAFFTVCLLIVWLGPGPVTGFRYLFQAQNIAHSHLHCNGRLADLLVRDGHEVVGFGVC